MLHALATAHARLNAQQLLIRHRLQIHATTRKRSRSANVPARLDLPHLVYKLLAIEATTCKY